MKVRVDPSLDYKRKIEFLFFGDVLRYGTDSELSKVVERGFLVPEEYKVRSTKDSYNLYFRSNTFAYRILWVWPTFQE
jgi:hypothetical protein